MVAKMKTPSKITLAECIDKYIQDHPDLSPSTVRGYQIIKRNRFQSVMHVPVRSVKDWQTPYNADRARLSPKTMQSTWSLIKAATAHSGVILPHIAASRLQRSEKAFLTHDEILRFVDESAGEKYRIAMLLGLHSLRLSEALALTWKDVDLDADTIRIHRAAVIDEHNRLTIKNTNKTDLSTRTVPIFIPELHDELKRLKPYRDSSDRVVPVMPNTVYRATSSFLSRHGFPHGGFHLLRHSFASLCYFLDIPILVTCSLGGWSDFQTVYRIYTHLEKAQITQKSTQLQQFFDHQKPLINQQKQVLSDGGSTPPISTKKALELLDFLRDYIANS